MISPPLLEAGRYVTVSLKDIHVYAFAVLSHIFLNPFMLSFLHFFLVSDCVAAYHRFYGFPDTS